MLRHPSIEACLGELARNAELRKLIGIESEERVPKKWNMSRFLDVLGREPHRTRLQAVFDAMIQRLGAAVPDLGRHTAGDSSGLSARELSEEAELDGLCRAEEASVHSCQGEARRRAGRRPPGS